MGIRITPSDQRDRGEGPPASNPLRCYDQGPGARPERIHLEMVPSVGPRSRLRIPVSMAETKVCLVSHIRWEGLRLYAVVFFGLTPQGLGGREVHNKRVRGVIWYPSLL